jgi:hypothetical protein
MNQAKQVAHNPSELLSTDQLDRIVFAIISRMNTLCVVEKVMDRSEAAAYLKYGQREFDRMYAKGTIKHHRLEPNGSPRFLPSELRETVKNS